MKTNRKYSFKAVLINLNSPLSHLFPKSFLMINAWKVWYFYFYNKKWKNIFRFPLQVRVFQEKYKKMHVFSRFWIIFPSKLPSFWHISDDDFDCKRVEILGVFIWLRENQIIYFLFFIKHKIFDDKRRRNEHLSWFLNKPNESHT